MQTKVPRETPATIAPAPQARSSPSGRGFGRAVRGVRLSLGMTQDELATAAGLSQRVIGKVERDSSRTQFQTIVAIARVFHDRSGVTIDQMLQPDTTGTRGPRW